MDEIIFNKLVRDKIPEMIQEQGKGCCIRLLENDEYAAQLNRNLKEEVENYLEGNTIDSLVDVQEIIRSILEYKGINFDEFDKLRQEKRNKSGGFELKIFLESVIDIDMK